MGKRRRIPRPGQHTQHFCINQLWLPARSRCVSASQVTLQRESLSFDERVRDAAEVARVLAEPTHITASCNTSGPIKVPGGYHHHRLRQLLLILRDNAVKYNRESGRITLDLSPKGGHAVLFVKNTSPGILPEVGGHVFERFHRGETTRQMNLEGCGSGLPHRPVDHAGTWRYTDIRLET
jgi:signal transduction histidine kinase